jgi:hypothetical protein
MGFMVVTPLGVAVSCRQFNPAMNFRAVMLGRKQYADARVVTKLENPDLQGSSVVGLRDFKDALCGITDATYHHIF